MYPSPLAHSIRPQREPDYFFHLRVNISDGLADSHAQHLKASGTGSGVTNNTVYRSTSSLPAGLEAFPGKHFAGEKRMRVGCLLPSVTLQYHFQQRTGHPSTLVGLFLLLSTLWTWEGRTPHGHSFG
jgi:hypothetical protein